MFGASSNFTGDGTAVRIQWGVRMPL
jgi:hypothetical protein